MSLRVSGARALLDDACVETDVLIAEGHIVEIGGASAGDAEIDGRGRLLAPALIDVHGDAFERQIMPRPNVFFPLDAALLETDRQLASNGIATAYHALTLSWEPGLRSVERGRAFVDGLAQIAPRFAVENRLQLRWETFALEAIPLIEAALDGPFTPSIAFNDHTSMTLRDPSVPVQERLFEHNPDFALGDPRAPGFAARRANDAARAGLSPEAYIERMLEVWERRPDVPDAIRVVAEMGRAAGAPMLSHDDTQVETRDFYRDLGARVSEFPMRVPVAEAARAAGDAVVFGAPNVVRGGSHIGSPSAADMVEAGLCDALASDYFYPSMLAAVARLDAERRAKLPALWSLVSGGPARLSGLSDRGEIALGKRADLVLVDWPGLGHTPTGAPPAVKTTLCAGRVAYLAA